MKTIVTNISEGIAYYQDLADWVRTFDIDPDDKNFDALALMEGHPDKIKCGDYYLYFLNIEINGMRYVVTHDEVYGEMKLMLERFFFDNMTDFFEHQPCIWEAYEAAEKAIAYRNGEGYFYTIWKYTGTNDAIA